MRQPILLTALLTLASCQLQDQAASTPQRPTVSFNTSTTAPGTVELEAGTLTDPNDFFDSPITLKYGTSKDTDLFVAWSPFQVLAQPGPDGKGSSDVVLGTRHRLWEGTDSRPSAAVVLSGKLPAASSANGLGSGEVDLRIAGVLNQQFGAVTANLFYQYGALGNPGNSGTYSEHTTTLTLSTPLSDRWGGFAELANVAVPSQRLDSLFAIVGSTFSPSSSLVLDGGITIGLSADAPDLQFFFGCTYNLGKLARLATTRR
jgi:hypothetical protein